MNQPTEAFLIQLRDLCRAHGVDFSADFGRVRFYSTDESPIYWVEADVESLEDLEAQLAQAGKGPPR